MKPTPNYLGYANLNAAIDCRAVDPYRAGVGAQGANGRRSHACGIFAGVAGTAVVRPVWGASDGSNDVTLTLAAGAPPLELEFSNVISGTATAVVIFWPRV